MTAREQGAGSGFASNRDEVIKTGRVVSPMKLLVTPQAFLDGNVGVGALEET